MSVSSSELINYKEIFQKELFSILSYWRNNALEPGEKGFYGAVDLSNQPILNANKSCVLNSRILWTFSAVAKKNNNIDYSKFANIAYNVISTDFYDEVNGGYFMELTPRNNVINDIKHTYANAFVLYSLCKYYEYNSSESVLSRITELFQILEEKTREKENLGYLEAFTREWNLYEENRMTDNNEPKSMNTHLHILEAYSALYKIWKNDLVRIRLSELLNLFINNIVREDGHLGIFFDFNFEEVESSKAVCSFGHDIEASWLLLEAAEILNDPEIKEKILPITVKMFNAVKREGVDSDGGLFLESSRFGSHLRTNKHWWLQAENLVGFMNAYQITKEKEYWEIVKRCWDFINNHVIDHAGGEWYTKVNRLGVPYLIEPEDDPSPYYRNDRKIDPWKCPYHNSRAMMELIDRIESLSN